MAALHSVLAIAVLQLISGTALGQVVICPLRDYEMSPTGQFCYRYVQSRIDYITANRTCVREGGSMVYVENAEENEYISTNYFTGDEFWIGLNDLDTEGTFKWTNASATVSYTNWASGHPTNNNEGFLDCVKFTASGVWQLHSSPCSSSNLPYLCKIRTCVQSLINEEFCAGEEPTLAPTEGLSLGVIIAIVVIVLVLLGATVLVLVCVLMWRFNNEAFHRYLCCCVSAKSTSTVHSLQQENERLRKQLSERKVSVSGRFAHAGELSGVPDGRGGVLPTIKQVPSFSPVMGDDRRLSRAHPPPLAISRPRSQLQGRGFTPQLQLQSGNTPVLTPQFISGAPTWRPMHQNTPVLVSRPVPPVATVEPIAEVKGDSGSESSDDEVFNKEEGGIADPREATNNDTTKQSQEQTS